ncbi:MAG: protein kinase, partial [Kiritimatiellae bacterium]|nr:protein kinase [Kiritimatiellia bacterium]
YDLLRKLGGGGFGVVYLARDTASGVEVAIKTLHPLLKHNAEEMDLLREKFALVSRLAHPNIATALVLHPVRDINVFDETARRELKLSPGDSVMVMRYAPGVTLSKWRRQFPDGVVPPDLALEIGRQVAAALDYAHGERIVHRDIKPGNVMVETVAAEPRPLDHGQGAPTLRVRILDFGLAAEIRSSMSRVSTEAGDTSGTRPYMAPEQWLGKKQDGRTDQYALACVLYELLSGAPPFAGVFETGDPMIMKSAVVGDAPDEIEDVDPATNEALLRALAKDPKARFPSCTAFVAALGGVAEPFAPSRGGGAAFGSHAENAGGAEPGGASRPGEPQSQAALEANVLRRKVALARALAGISAEDRADLNLSTFVSDAEIESDAAKEAIDRNRFTAAAACLDRADAALARLKQDRREPAAREDNERLYAPAQLDATPRSAVNFNLAVGPVYVRDQMLRIANAEGPITENLLFTRVLEEWGFESATENRLKVLKQSIPPELPITKHLGGKTYWPVDADPSEWHFYRVPGVSPRSHRTFKEIPVEEIAAAIAAEYRAAIAAGGSAEADPYPGAVARLGLPRHVTADMKPVLDAARHLK